MFLNGYWRKRADYNRRADSARASLQGAIDYTRKGREALAAKHYPGEGESPSITIPDLLEPIIAYRAWGVNNEGLLRPTIMSDLSPLYSLPDWEPRKPKQCHCWYNTLGIMNHAVPGEDCKCGYYAAINLNGIMHPNGPYSIVGTVALWGKIVKHDKGYRSEYAYPVKFVVSKCWGYSTSREAMNEIGRRVEENYGALFNKKY